MREYIKQPEPEPNTLGNNPKAYNQAPTNVILQRYKTRSIQRYATDEDDELLQGKFEDTTQLMDFDEDEETLQGKFDTAQREENEENNSSLLTSNSSFKNDSSLLTSNSSLKKDSSFLPPRSSFNQTGLPDNLKNGIENLSGYSMDDVKVHYNSSKPAQLQALAYTQGTDIHVAPGQEKHLPHEAWHVAQQKQGRVQPTMQLQGVNVNDNEGLEKEADGTKRRILENYRYKKKSILKCSTQINNSPIQKVLEIKTGNYSDTYGLNTSDSDIEELAKLLYDDWCAYIDNKFNIENLIFLLRELMQDKETNSYDEGELIDLAIERFKKQDSESDDSESESVTEYSKMVKASDSDISQLHLEKQKGLIKWQYFLKTKNPDLYKPRKLQVFYVRLDIGNLEDFKKTGPIISSQGFYYGYVCGKLL